MNIDKIETELAACKIPEDIYCVMRRDMKSLGYDHFAYVCHILETVINPPAIGYTNYPVHWLTEYTSNNYGTIDPIMHHAVTQTVPIFWSVHDDWASHPLGEGAVKFMAAVKENGWDSGVCIPCFSSNCTRGFINLFVKKPIKDPVEKAAKAAWLCKYYHDHTIRIGIKSGAIETSLGVRLTNQETNVMRYVAEGQTSTKIGKTLGIAKRTVDGYIASIQLKLDAVNRQQALFKAVNLGLIYPKSKLGHEIEISRWITVQAF